MKNYSVVLAHAAALGTAVVWGLTFVSTKILLAWHTPLEIAVYRFVLCIGIMMLLRPVIFRHKGGWKTELLFMLAGMTGVSLYFFFENVALTCTYASNVSLIVATTPFFTGLVACAVLKEKLYANFFTGFVVAITGIACISFNGVTALGLSLGGDLLSFCAALCWAVYSAVTRTLFNRGYPLLLATRRILLWGLVTAALGIPFQEAPLTPPLFTDAVSWANFLFLGGLASAACFITWNYALNVLGAVRCTAYVYFSPVVTVLGAVIILGEQLTPLSATGMALTLAGLILSERHGNIFSCLKMRPAR